MVRHNNMIPHAHFHKKWQKRVRLWFDQPMKKVRRQRVRARKARKLAPRPVNKLRPIVRCPTVRYNTKVKAGRGFSLKELKAAGINPHFARTVGIAVDHRRRNKSVETLLINKQRLKEYMTKLILEPKKSAPTVICEKIDNKVGKRAGKLKTKVPTKEEKELCAFTVLRKARADLRLVGAKLRKKALATEDDILKMPKKKREYDD